MLEDEYRGGEDCEGRTSLWLAAAYGNMTRFLAQMAMPWADVNHVCTVDGSTALHVAASNGHVELVRLLVEAGAEVNKPADGGITALHFATMAGHLKVARLLVEEAGVDLDPVTSSGMTPLHVAAQEGWVELVRLLLEAGAAVNLGTSSQCLAPIVLAASKGHAEVVRVLVAEGGAEVDRPTEEGATGLHLAAQNGHPEAARMLMEAGADVDKVTAGGHTPLHVAAEHGRLEVARLLVEAGADVALMPADGFPPLQTAARAGNTDVAQLLLEEAGADINQPGEAPHGSTPLNSAVGGGHQETALFLLDRGARLGENLSFWQRSQLQARLVDWQQSSRSRMAASIVNLKAALTDLEAGIPVWCGHAAAQVVAAAAPRVSPEDMAGAEDGL
mmetsp:Transcript_12586/g.35359  ORF Transcript_12586/g.35359 Transcript_12586/m.35359 type:complete len:389 (+) Transcript_12586:68-1234(+)